MKKCTKCNETKPVDQFYIDVRLKSQRTSKCKACADAAAVARYHADKSTPQGFARVLYQNMLARVRGQARNGKRYAGLPILPRDEFMAVALSSPEFLRLHSAWIACGRQRLMAPSVDRIDSDSGYLRDNIQFVSWEQNKRKGYEDVRKRTHFACRHNEDFASHATT